MLVLSRKENESIVVEPAEGLDPTLTLREVFSSGAIVVTLKQVGLRTVRLVIEAPRTLKISRREPQLPAVSP